MKISVVILSKTLSNLKACIPAVRRHEPTADIVIVDDGIHPADRALPELYGSHWHKGDKPFVYARNANIGIRAALACIEIDVTTCRDSDPRFLTLHPDVDGVVLLNDDAVLQTVNGFSILAQAAADNPEYGIIASTCNNVGNRAQKPQGIGLREDRRMVCFVAVYIPRTTIERVGLLDERYVGYGFEDDDYCLRVRRAGLKIGTHDGCYVDHGSLKSSFRGNPSTPANLAQNRDIFIGKWGAHPL